MKRALSERHTRVGAGVFADQNDEARLADLGRLALAVGCLACLVACGSTAGPVLVYEGEAGVPVAMELISDTPAVTARFRRE